MAVIQREDCADSIRLHPTVLGDFPALIEFQSDRESNAMAGTKPRTHAAFFAAWERNFTDSGVNSHTIKIGGEIVGNVARFQADGHDCIGYWIARTHWGRGVASRAIKMFLKVECRRPLYATTARSNVPSQRVLAKCGFRCIGYRMGDETERYLAREIAEFVLY